MITINHNQKDNKSKLIKKIFGNIYVRRLLFEKVKEINRGLDGQEISTWTMVKSSLRASVYFGYTDNFRALLATATQETLTEFIKSRHMYRIASTGKVDILHVMHQCCQQQSSMDEGIVLPCSNILRLAAGHGNFEIVRYILEVCTHSKNMFYCRMAMQAAAGNGHMSIVKLIHSHGGISLYNFLKMPLADMCYYLPSRSMLHDCGGIDRAAMYGHIDIVKFLTEKQLYRCTTYAMTSAAQNGDLDLVHYLHENRTEGCTTDALDGAAGRGHFTMVEFLHSKRSEGCTTKAMDSASSNGHLDIVQFLHHNRSEGATVDAMDMAAAHGHMEIVRFLAEKRSEGCSEKAILLASAGGHLEIVIYLLMNRSENNILKAMNYAASNGHKEVFEYLFNHGKK
ncbi:hypothetical protein SAMD00019534_028920, partial [Acytostelium subglobosum LB1]|uniref:hypothetical protein n=1 Tax=Acytostelium subglobosum LB1 TaxID=1410327 RepID=UPI0006449CC1